MHCVRLVTTPHHEPVPSSTGRRLSFLARLVFLDWTGCTDIVCAGNSWSQQGEDWGRRLIEMCQLTWRNGSFTCTVRSWHCSESRHECCATGHVTLQAIVPASIAIHIWIKPESDLIRSQWKEGHLLSSLLSCKSANFFILGVCFVWIFACMITPTTMLF